LLGAVTPPFAATPFEDYLAEMSEWIVSSEAQEARDYWGEHLRGAGPTWLPRRANVGYTKDNRLRAQPIAIHASTTEALRRFAAANRVTLFHVLVAAKIAALAKIGGTTDATIMFFATCRETPRLMGTVGALMNLVHLRVPFVSGEAFTDLAKRVRTAHASAVKYQRCPFELVRRIQPTVGAYCELPYAPLFNFVDTRPAARPRTGQPAKSGSLHETFDVGPPPEITTRDVEFESYYFQLESWRDGLKGFLRYSPRLYANATVKQYLAAFRRILEDIPSDVCA
jgi:hypothetical protein